MTGSPHRGRFLAGQVVGGLGFGLCYLPFLGAVVDDVGEDPAARPWAIAALGAGLLSPAAGIAGGMLTTGLASPGRAPSSESGWPGPWDTAGTLRAAGYAFNVASVLQGLLPAFVAAGRRRADAPVWPRILPSLTAVTAVAGATSQLDSKHSDRLASAGSLVWLGVVAWVLDESFDLRRSLRKRSAMSSVGDSSAGPRTARRRRRLEDLRP